MSRWNKKRDVMQHYDLTAHIYDTQYAEEQTAKIEAAMESVNMEKQDLVLDVGCGTGLLFKYVANKAKTIVGLDISRKILFQAKKHAKTFPNVHIIWADADNMPLKENIFDYVLAVTLIQNMPDPTKTLNEVKRVTKDNSVIIVTGLKKKFPIEIFEGLLQNAGLNIIALKNENLKCHVAVCTRFLH
ncbi:MAG: methyltransferase domain-containing protein [Candidatus Bathyarchaeia archaeon]|nr:methyltransferase domain-containing protein [Candidatus Bathyarchaeia archaeon]MDI6904453.1 methyltransferase domain-containing protein [Candidatus Bathyarchaeia archaeon]